MSNESENFRMEFSIERLVSTSVVFIPINARVWSHGSSKGLVQPKGMRTHISQNGGESHTGTFQMNCYLCTKSNYPLSFPVDLGDIITELTTAHIAKSYYGFLEHHIGFINDCALCKAREEHKKIPEEFRNFPGYVEARMYAKIERDTIECNRKSDWILK